MHLAKFWYSWDPLPYDTSQKQMTFFLEQNRLLVSSMKTHRDFEKQI